MEDDDVNLIRYTQGIRKSAITSLMADGKLPGDTEQANLVIKLLDGMDRTTLGKARISTDEAANQQAAQANELITRMFLEKAKRNAMPVLENPAVPADVVVIDVVPGEMELSKQEDSYEAFMARMDSIPNE